MNPLAAIGGGATVTSVLLNALAGKKVDKARSETIEAERGRQAAFDAEADALNKGARDRYVDFGGQQDTRASSLAQMFAPPPAATSGPMLPASSNDMVTRAVDARQGEVQAYGEQQGAALGKLRSFGDLLGTISRSQARDAGSVAQIGGFKRGSASIVPQELEVANGAGDKLKFWADLSAGAGKVATLAGLSGSNPFASAAPSAPLQTGVSVTPTAVGATVPQASPLAMQFNPYRIY